jgi:ABC-type lipoprotein release transport system permease subunit
MKKFSHSENLKKEDEIMFFLKFAWRNIWRNKRRTIITITAITFATMITVIMRGIQLGSYEYFIRTIAGDYSGYIQIQREGYKDDPSLRKTFIYSDEIKKTIESISDIIAYAPRLYADVMISSGENSYGGIIYGIDPEIELNFSNFHKKVKQGRFLNTDSSYEVILGYKLFENLKIKLGDEIVILAQGFDGALWDMKFKVVGVVKLGYTELDNSAIFMNLKDAQELLSAENRVSVIAILLPELGKIEKVRQKLLSELTQKELVALSWEDVMVELKQSIDFDNASGVLFLAFLIIIVAFGILNTISMSVVERFNEFGISLAIGFKNQKLVLIVFLEIIFIALIGILLGCLLGGIFNYYLIKNPIVLTGEFASAYEEFGFEPKFISSLQPRIFINTGLSILIVSIISSIIPLYKVYKLEPLKGIRFT